MRISSPDYSSISEKTFIAALCLLLSLLLMNGCASLHKAPAVPTQGPPDALALLDRLQHRNSGLLSFKGVGRMRLTDHNGRQHARIFWAADGNRKIRMEIMGPSGRPLMSFAYDGERIYLISHTENRFFTKTRHDADLEKLISIPIKVRIALDLLAGRAPFERYRTAAVQDESAEGWQCLVLEKEVDAKEVDKIFVEGLSDVIRRFESFGQDGHLQYRVEFHDLHRYDGFLLPGKIVFSNGKAVRMQLTNERFWPNVPMAADLFVLKKPEMANSSME